MDIDQTGEVQLQSQSPSEPDLSFLGERHRSVLNIITECSPCSEPKLFIAAINAKLDCFGDTSLSELRDVLGQCVRELKASGLIKVLDDEIVMASEPGAWNEEEDPAALSLVESRGEDGVSEDASWSDMQRTFADLEETPERAPDGQKSENDTGSAGSEAELDVLDLTDELEIVELEDIAVALDDTENEIPSDAEPDSASSDEGSGQAQTAETANALPPDDEADILDLTDALELMEIDDEPTEVEDASFEPGQADEELRPPTNSADSTQRTEEPSREEIIDAMRRFMSDERSERE